ncbi:MAG: DUF2461 domain-containing protein [Prevotella sp.]|nr:DUF2461 domain-containing protein [Prevotella sp.]
MDIKLIMTFLRQVMANNNREWFHAHKADYEAARAEWEKAVVQARDRIIGFDPSVAAQPLKDCTYRFYRDTRFSPDKSPYKNHFGAYMNAHGKKALRGGYYIHLEPEGCLLAVGNYWLPTNILTSCRNEMMANEAEWLRCVESKAFKKYYDAPDDASWESPQGFGLAKLKTCPSGFPRDYEHVRYLRLKDYCAWHRVDEQFFQGDEWLDQMELIFKAAKPMMDFLNAVIDDYE